MKVVTMKADPRESGGSSVARRLRRAGRLPAVVYGEGKDPQHVAVDMREFTLAVGRGARLLDLQTGDGPASRVLLKDVQYDALGRKMLHADFLRLHAKHKLDLSVPLEIDGVPKGAAEGGILTVLRATLTVRCLPSDIPENIRLDVAPLLLGETVYARDIVLPADVELAQEPDSAILTVSIPRGIDADEEAEDAEGEGAEGEGAEGGGETPSADAETGGE